MKGRLTINFIELIPDKVPHFRDPRHAAILQLFREFGGVSTSVNADLGEIALREFGLEGLLDFLRSPIADEDRLSAPHNSHGLTFSNRFEIDLD